jgi:WD40 repeat protein/tRNA A-37 threonylcarbamoyl transferase component Bud32
MTDPTVAGDPLDPVVADYLQRIESGQSPDRDELLAMHPDLADRLRAFFADLDRFGKQASAFRLPNSDSTVSAGGAGATDLPRVRYIGDYELLEEIARGGMGVVYKARQVSLNRTVALKMILAGQLASEADVRRFKQEAEAAASLDHPNILPIYEVGEHAGHQYFSMKLVQGRSLAQLLAESPRTAVRGLVETLTKVTRAVHFAHQRGILHRDLKPSNILTDRDGTPYVTDFGLAKKVDADDGRTRTGAVLGTPAYMAPEQARGEKGLSVAADVYSLGAMLYEVLTGRPPFRGDTVLDVLRQVTDRDPAHPRSVNPDADRDLTVIALKCLEKDPAKRYAGAAALADDLDRWRNGEPIEARPATRRERVVKWARRNPLAAALLGLAAFTSIAILGLLIVALQQAALAIRGEANATKARNDAVEQKQIAEDRLWQATFEQGRAERLSGNRWRALELIAEAARTKVTPELEREAAQAVAAFGLRLVSKTPGRSLSFSGGEGPFIVFSHDGTLFAAPNSFTRPGTNESFSGVTVHETLTGRIVAEVSGTYSGGDFAFHPTRPVLAIHRDGRIVLHDVPAGTETELGPGKGPICFDPTGRYLATNRDRVVIHDLSGGPPQVLAIKAEPLRFTADGLLLRSVEENKWRYHLWDLTADRAVASSPEGWWAVSVDPTGRWAALDHAVWDLRAGKELWRLPEDLHRPPYRAGIPFSPTEPLVAYEREGARTIDLFDLTAGRVRDRLLIPGRGPRALLYGRFRPDGTVLSVEDDYQGDVTLWEVGTGKLLTTLPEHNKAYWSPDGRYLASFCSSGWVDLPGGGRAKNATSHIRVYEIAALPGRARLNRPVNRLSFAADGTELAAADTLWRVVKAGDRARLNWAAQVADKRTTFFDSAGRRWTFPLDETLKPDSRYTLFQAGPAQRTVAFPGRPHVGFASYPDAGRIKDLVVHPDGRRAVLVWDGYREKKPDETGRIGYARLECWDLDGPRLAGVWAEAGGASDLLSPALSPDGKRLAAVGNGGLKVWDAETGNRLVPDLNLSPGFARQAAFTADGQNVVVGFDGGRLALATPQGAIIADRSAHDGDVTALAVSPDGRFVVSAADDRTVAVWDAKTLIRLAQWTAADGAVTALAFAPDSRTLAIGDAKGVVQVWDVPAILDELATLGIKARE